MPHLKKKKKNWSSFRNFLTCCDVLRPKYDLLCYTAAHTDVHLSQKLRASLAPAVILREHGHLGGGKEEDGEQNANERMNSLKHITA